MFVGFILYGRLLNYYNFNTKRLRGSKLGRKIDQTNWSKHEAHMEIDQQIRFSWIFIDLGRQVGAKYVGFENRSKSMEKGIKQ